MKAKSNFNKIFEKYKTYDTSNGFGSRSQWEDAANNRLKANKPVQSEFPELTKAEDLGELKRAYRKLVKVHHPDKGGSEETFKRMQNLYDKLLENFQ